MAYMYILKCDDGTFYTGSTVDLEKRIEEHQGGRGANYTARRIPVELVYYEVYESVADAFNREKQVQNWSHAKKRALIEENYCDLSILAKKKFGKPASRYTAR